MNRRRFFAMLAGLPLVAKVKVLARPCRVINRMADPVSGIAIAHRQDFDWYVEQNLEVYSLHADGIYASGMPISRPIVFHRDAFTLTWPAVGEIRTERRGDLNFLQGDTW